MKNGETLMKDNKKMLMLALLVLITLTVVFSVIAAVNFGKEKSVRQNRPEYVSIIQLIATPEKYDGMLVRVTGVGNLEFEGNAIYLNKEDLAYRTHNAVWLDFQSNTTVSYEEAKDFNGKYVIVEGVFDKNNTGHMGDFHGAITDITRYELNWAEAELAKTEG